MTEVAVDHNQEFLDLSGLSLVQNSQEHRVIQEYVGQQNLKNPAASFLNKNDITAAIEILYELGIELNLDNPTKLGDGTSKEELALFSKSVSILLSSSRVSEEDKRKLYSVVESNLDLLLLGAVTGYTAKESNRLLHIVRNRSHETLQDEGSLALAVVIGLAERLGEAKKPSLVVRVLSPSRKGDFKPQEALDILHAVEPYSSKRIGTCGNAARLIIANYARALQGIEDDAAQYVKDTAVEMLRPLVPQLLATNRSFDEYMPGFTRDVDFQVALALLNDKEYDYPELLSKLSVQLQGSVCFEDFLDPDQSILKVGDLARAMLESADLMAMKKASNGEENFYYGVKKLSQTPGGLQALENAFSTCSRERRLDALAIICDYSKRANSEFNGDFKELMEELAAKTDVPQEVVSETDFVRYSMVFGNEWAAQYIESLQKDDLEFLLSKFLNSEFCMSQASHDLTYVVSEKSLRFGLTEQDLKGNIVLQCWHNAYVNAKEGSYLSRQQKALLTSASPMLKEFGIGKDILEAWISTDRVALAARTIVNSLATISALESEQPGSAKLLNEQCGIRLFSRYRPELLLRQASLFRAKERPQLNGEYLALFLPLSDHNGAFSPKETHDCETMSGVYREFDRDDGLPIIVMETGSSTSLLRQHIRLKNRFGALKYAIIGGHGDPTGITLSRISDFLASDLRPWKVKESVRDLYSDGAQIILRACKGGVENGLAEAASTALRGKKVTIAASNEDSWTKSFDIIRDAEGKPRMRVEFETSSSRQGKPFSTLVVYNDPDLAENFQR